VPCVCYAYYCMDNEMNAVLSGNEEQKDYWHGMIGSSHTTGQILCTEMGMVVCDLAVQTYGGYGFCREYPVEQMMRVRRSI